MPTRTQPRLVFIADVLVTDAVAAHIRARSGLDPAEIVSVLRSPLPRIGRWVRDDGGNRLCVRARAGPGRDFLAVLSPLGSDAWRLTGACVQPRERGA